MPFSIGENIGPYRIVDRLGQGGMATVFKAYHASLDRYVALKVLHPAFLEDPTFLTRFQREARIVAKLDHPSIVPVYDFGEHREHPYLVMRFVEGETLKARLASGPLEQSEVTQIAEAVGGALSYAHSRGVLHRDIKPSNIILSSEGQIYLTDFGLARMAEAGESTLSRDMLVGTPQYISPEQASADKRLDARTDVYSLGVVLYELLVGRAPFQADTPYAIVHDHIFTPLPLPRSINADLPEEIERMLLKALAKDPDDRFATVGEMLEAYRHALGEAAAQASTPAAMVQPVEAAVERPEAVPEGAVPDRVEPEETPPDEEMPEALEREGLEHVESVPAESISAAPVPAAPKPVPSSAAESAPARGWRSLGWQYKLAAGSIIFGVVVGLTMVGLREIAERRGLDRNPARVRRLLDEALTALQDHDMERARGLYQEAMEADPNQVPVYLEAADTMVDMGEPEMAMEVYQAGLDENPGDFVLHRSAAELALLLEDWDSLGRSLEWMRTTVPEEPVTRAFDALLSLATGNPCQEVRQELEDILSTEPELDVAHYARAFCHLDEGRTEPALQDLRFVADSPASSPAMRTLADNVLIGFGERRRTVEQILQELFDLAEEQVPEGELRDQFVGMLGEAESNWRSGNREEATQNLGDARAWVQEHRERLGPVLAGELTSKLDQLLQGAPDS
jgi:tRNA A-37 threonylcarbamoyl transferase component Bud32